MEFGKEIEERRQLIEREQSWTQEDEGRQKRYEKYFSGDNDLKHDKTLRNYGHVDNDLELANRRRVVECLMDNFNAHKNELVEQAIVTSNVAAFNNKKLALIRNIWPRLFAFEFCSVIPVSTPNTRVYTIDHRYDSAGGVYAAGTSIYTSHDPDYADDLGEGVEPRKLDFNITGATISVVAKKLITDWTIEAEQDARSQHNLNVQSEMMKVLAMQIEREINSELIAAIDTAATTNTNWSSTQPLAANRWASQDPKSFDQTLFDAVMDADKEIFDRVYQRGNVLLCGSQFATRLEKLTSFKHVASGPDTGSIVAGPNLFGTLNNRIKVFVDPDYTTDKAILAHKSDNWMYTGYVYCPYIPLWRSDKIPATTFTFAQGLMTRYGTYAKDGDFFATITVTT